MTSNQNMILALTVFLVQACTEPSNIASKDGSIANTHNNSMYTDKIGRVIVTTGPDKFETKEALALNEEGISFSKNGDLISARTKLLQALQIEPTNYVILNNLGIVEQNALDYKKAIEYYKRSLTESQSTYLKAAQNLALTYFQARKYDECLDLCETLISFSSDHMILGSAHMYKCLTFLETGKCQQANLEYSQTADYFKNLPEIQSQLRDLKTALDKCSGF